MWSSGKMRLLSYGAVIAGGLVLSLSGVARAQSALFTISDVVVDHDVRGRILAIPFFEAKGASVVAKGKDKDGARLFSFFEVDDTGRLNGQPRLRIEMPDDAIFYDFADLGNTGAEDILFLSNLGVSIYNKQTERTELLVETSSIYRQGHSPRISNGSFAQDLNGDGYADLLIADFDRYHVFLNDQAGGFAPAISLEMSVEMRMATSFGETGNTPTYSKFPVYLFDVNFDGLTDITFLRDQTLYAFLQIPDGAFETTAELIPLGIDVIGNSWAESARARDLNADQSNLKTTTVAELLDVNKDGIVDVYTQTIRAKGLFNRSNEHGFHFGQQGPDGLLSFSEEPDNSFTLQGGLIQHRTIDFSTDGRMDFMSAVLKVGVTKVIGALISGSINAKLHFFSFDGKNGYPDKADYTKNVSVKFDLSRGSSSQPLVELADINGDRVKDLIINDGTKGLKIYRGANKGDDRLFVKKAQRVVAELPKTGSNAQVADLNGDGREDLMVNFDRLGVDGQENRNRIRVFIAR